jgi:hypothetical protein
VNVDADSRERALAALEQLRTLLGPSTLAPDVADADASTIEQLIEDAMSELRRILPGYTGPEASAVAALALELADVRLILAGERTQRRLDGVLQVQRALSRLRAVGSTEQMLVKAPEAVCKYCGFAAAILFRVDEGLVTPAAAYSTRDPDFGGKVMRTAAKRGPIQLDAMLLENEMLRRRAPVIVHDALNDPRVVRDLTSGTEQLGRWVAEDRPVQEDYRRAIGDPPARIVRIWLIAVAIFQRGTGSAQFADIELVGDDGTLRL